MSRSDKITGASNGIGDNNMVINLCVFIYVIAALFVTLSMIILSVTTIVAVTTVYIEAKLEHKKGLPKWLYHCLLKISPVMCINVKKIVKKETKKSVRLYSFCVKQ